MFLEVCLGKSRSAGIVKFSKQHFESWNTVSRGLDAVIRTYQGNLTTGASASKRFVEEVFLYLKFSRRLCRTRSWIRDESKRYKRGHATNQDPIGLQIVVSNLFCSLPFLSTDFNERGEEAAGMLLTDSYLIADVLDDIGRRLTLQGCGEVTTRWFLKGRSWWILNLPAESINTKRGPR